MLYNSYFVVRSAATGANLHTDYVPSVGTNAFTVMTPLRDYKSDGFQLLYLDADGAQRQYRYLRALWPPLNSTHCAPDLLPITAPLRPSSQVVRPSHLPLPLSTLQSRALQTRRTAFMCTCASHLALIESNTGRKSSRQ